MATQINQLIQHRVSVARAKLQEVLRVDGPTQDLKNANDELSLALSVETRARTRRLLPVAIGLAAIALTSAGVAELIRFRSASIHAEVESQAVTFVTGENEEDPLEDVSVDFAAVDNSRASGSWCVGAVPSGKACQQAAIQLKLSSLTVSQASTLRFRIADGCQEVQVLDGFAKAIFAARMQPSSTDVSEPEHIYPIRLEKGAALTLCSKEKIRSQFEHISRIAFADRRFGFAEIKPNVAAATAGAVTVLGLNKTVRVSTSDVWYFEMKDTSSLSLTTQGHIDAVLQGTASIIRRTVAGAEQDYMPTILDWLRSSESIQAFLAIFSGIVGTIWSIKSRFLSGSL